MKFQDCMDCGFFWLVANEEDDLTTSINCLRQSMGRNNDMGKTKKTEKSKPAGKSPLRKVQFEFSAPEAGEVYLVGNFNQWNTRANLMEKDRKGIWKATLSLETGRYEYRFFVDGNWKNDPSCSGCVPNEFGSNNCVRIVE